MKRISEPAFHDFWESKINVIIYLWLLTGTLGILITIILHKIVLHIAASSDSPQNFVNAMLEEKLSSGSTAAIWFGLGLYYILSLCFSCGFFLTFQRFSLLRKNKMLSGLLYGIFTWTVLNYFLQATFLSKAIWSGLTDEILVLVVLMFTLGLPSALISGKYYSQRH